MAKSYYRKRNYPNDDDDKLTDIEWRHNHSETMDDSLVTQMSRTKWTFSAPDENDEDGCTVERVLHVDDDDLMRKHVNRCSFKEDFEYSKNEEDWNSYCPSCDICSEVYICSCARAKSAMKDSLPIVCMHMHKVHKYNEKRIKEQRPHNVKVSIEDDIKMLQQIKKAIKEEDQASFSEELRDFVQNLQVKFMEAK